MIVLEGTPGAGKTTLAGWLLAAAPDRVVVFPEAQPPSETSCDAMTVRALLDEDRSRVTVAGRVAATAPGALIVSDRCHLGVLAYRYARAVTGRGPREDFEHARALCDRYQLHTAHAGDHLVVQLLDP